MDEMNIAPEEAMAFEDSRNGILSSLAARLSTIITTNGYTAEDDFSGAAIVLDQLGEPSAPFKVGAGDAHGHSYVNVEMVKALHKAAHG
jgi:beta-phosphoglucomutase-like phosphatase (HAD superfamily)